MSVAWHVARRSCAQWATYRGATFAGAFTNTVFGFLRVYVLFAVLEARPGLAGFDARDAATYAFVTQGLLAVVFESGYGELATRIRSGDVVADLYRPVDLQLWYLAADVGRAAFSIVFRGLPPTLVGALAFGITVPTSPLLWSAFAASVVLAVTISFGIRFLAALSGFWLLDVRGVQQIAGMLTFLLAGLIVPLTFFPEELVGLVRALPFAGIVQLPLELFLGRHPGALDVLSILGRQLAWAVVLLGVSRHVASRAMRKVVVQGG